MSRESSPRTKVRSLAVGLLAALCALAAPSRDAAALDQYPGDTVIYGVSTGTIQPNVLVILDNSGSMSGEIITGDPYTPSTTYTVTNGCSGAACSSNAVYRWNSSQNRWASYIANVSTVTCANASNALTTSGTYQGRLRTSGTCSSNSGSYALGNYINWLAGGGGTRSKMEVAQEVLSDLVNSTSGVRFGLMIFNSDEGGHIAGVGDSYGYLNYDAYIQDMDTIFSGSVTNRDAYVNTVNNITPSTWTPLGETLFEAMRYYKGGQTAFNGSYTYTTPIQYACQKNYVILITDGMSTQDRNTVLTSICSSGDCDGDGFEPANDPTKSYGSNGSDYLDDVAKYLYDTDILTDGVEEKTIGKQNVITYTVGFGLAGVAYAERLLQETATNGGGVYYSAASTSGLSESLRQIISSIVEDDTSFVAPVLPVSPENRTYTGDRLYMGFFKPKSNAFWSGNLKKYGLDVNGNILDSNGNAATNADGSIKDNAVSYWGTVSDGSDVEVGGSGALLLTRSTARNIYTYTGSSASLTASSNAFTTANAAITAASLAVADSTEKNKLINYVHGLDAYDEDGNGLTTEKRDWILGDVLHSKPTVVNYSTFTLADEGDCSINRSLVFVGSNDGMLHAFRDCDGSELWAFVPQDLLPNLQYSHGTTHSYYVDSSPSTYVYDADRDGNIETADNDKVIIMFGERRGGGFYYAIDVTTPASPLYLWRISSTESPFSDDYSELAETWSEPVISKVYIDSGGTNVVKVAAFIGAGYDNVAEDAEPAAAATKGRGIYAVEIATLASGVPVFTTSGHKIWGYTIADNSNLARPILSQLAILDINGNGYADRLYAGDTGGGLWRFDVGSNLTSAWTGRKIFQSNPGADSSTGRKIFYKPAVTLEVGYEMLFFGTGDRAHPVSATEVNRLYAVKDTGQTTAKTESNLSDATSSSSVNIASTYGWYAKLNTNTEEKVLAQAAVFGGVAYYTTYTPVVTASMCSTGGGTSRLYALEYLTAGPAYNYNASNDTDGAVVKDSTDRSTIIGSGIASGIVTVVSPRGFTALVGSGGAIVKPDVKQSGSSIPTYWREVR